MKQFDLKKYSWKMIWAGDWSLLDVSDWEEHYLSTLKIGNRPFLDKSVFVIKNGKSSCWVDEDYLQGSFNTLSQIYKTKKDIQALAKQLKRSADKAMKLMKRKIVADKKTYLNYSAAIREYYIPHVHVKYVVDGLSEEQRKKWLPILEEARVYAERVFTQTLVFDREFARQLNKKTEVKPELLLSMRRGELLNFFDTNKLPGKKQLTQRLKFSVSIADNVHNFNVYTGTQAKKLAAQLTSIQPSENLKGQTAFPGLVKGRVWIINDPRKPKGFAKGDILVTGMTRPEYLSLMGKAAAIVTDAGGVLSHAAISAREMKKPCVIGTKFGTKLLKDGDLVEVDADNAIVKIIK